MQKRHDNQLWARLDELYANGVTFISFGEVYHWYNIRRLAKTPWRDIKAKWEELLKEKQEKYTDPQVTEVMGGYSLFFPRNPRLLSKLAE
ncbi:MAG TPA: hypothetical protein VJU77_10525 [Chthoniobacterales bacterium]|nr:hypothetical protein [Chthoniobacterales bacterium]